MSRMNRSVIALVAVAVVGVIGIATVTNIVDAHDDVDEQRDSTEATQEPDTMELYERTLRDYPSPCAEILRIVGSGEESGRLRALGFFEPVHGLPQIESARFQRCMSNRLTGEAALSFVINDSLTLVLSNSGIETQRLVDELGLNGPTVGLPVGTGTHRDLPLQATIRSNDSSVHPVPTGSASFSIENVRGQGWEDKALQDLS